MDITISKQERRVPVTILKVAGKVDSSNYQEFTEKAMQTVAQDGFYLLIDLSECDYMSSAGLRSLNEIFMFFKKSFPKDEPSRLSARMKLLNPQPKVLDTLKMTGVDVFFEIHSDMETALASF